MLVDTLSYMFHIALMYIREIPVCKGIPDDVLWYAIVRFLQVNKRHMQILCSLSIIFHQSPKNMSNTIVDLPGMKLNWFPMSSSFV